MTDKVVVPIAYKVAGRTRATNLFLLLMLIQLFVMAAEANTQDCKFCSFTVSFFFIVQLIRFSSLVLVGS